MRWPPSAATPRASTRWCPADLVIDHSVQVDRYGNAGAFAFNVDREYERNGERYQLLRWAQTAFSDLRVVPPGTGIVHQVNLEYLAGRRPGARGRPGATSRLPDTLVGTDSHTTMISALGVLGYGVGGIEAEAVLLGQPLYQPLPTVVGVRLHGELPLGSTATDLVLVISQMLRNHGVVGAFVEFAGDGLAGLALADRATISNMSPEYGATTALFPIDDETLAYLRLTGRATDQVALVEAYASEQGLWRGPGGGPGLRRDARAGPGERRAERGRTATAAGPRASARIRESFAAAYPGALPASNGSSRATAEADLEGEGGVTDGIDAPVAIEIDGHAVTIRSGSVAIAAITAAPTPPTRPSWSGPACWPATRSRAA